jgi:hypothetical protein
VEEEFQVFDACWQQGQSTATVPKLLVFIDETDTAEEIEARQRSAALGEYIYQNYHAPLLHLCCDDVQAVSEITAAMQAME